MSGSKSSAPASACVDVHAGAGEAGEQELERRTRRGRRQMLVVLLVCAAPVVASYLAYFGWHPQARSNYAELIVPPRDIPDDLPLSELQGRPFPSSALKGRWLLVVVSGGECDATCERLLWIQRQLRESLGRDAERVDKLWLIDDRREPSPAAIKGVESGGRPALILRVPSTALTRWLEPAPDHVLEDHLYIVDPHGAWMMRTPVQPDPPRLRRDLEKLLRASDGWDLPRR